MKNNSTNEQLIKRWRWTARVFGIIVTGWWLALGIGYGFSEPGPFIWESAVITALIIITTAGFIIAWRRERNGGIILLISGVAYSIFAGLVSGHNHLFAILLTGLPFIIIGTLFLMAWQKGKKAEI